jgi:outer membrane receptor protein involved in Fe transport
VIYEISPKTQAFVNFSRSWQPPSLDNLVDFTEGPNSSVVYTPLQPQHAWTIEIGTPATIRGLSGSYRFITPGCTMNCWNLTIGSGIT